jgi:hypothetical protein
MKINRSKSFSSIICTTALASALIGYGIAMPENKANKFIFSCYGMEQVDITDDSYTVTVNDANGLHKVVITREYLANENLESNECNYRNIDGIDFSIQPLVHENPLKGVSILAGGVGVIGCYKSLSDKDDLDNYDEKSSKKEKIR